jgi:DNA replication protein DnaC
LIEARDERKVLRFQKQIASYELLIVDELGFAPLSKTGAELLFERCSANARNEPRPWSPAIFPSKNGPEVSGSEQLIGVLLDRLTHPIHMLEMNGDSYLLKQNRRKCSS